MYYFRAMLSSYLLKQLHVLLQSNPPSRRNFAKRLAEFIYSKEERKRSNVNGRAVKDKLSPKRMEELKAAVFNQYPAEGETEKAAWTDCVRAIDEAGRKRKD